MGYELIETIEVGAGGAASIEFTGIPTDGIDLALKLSLRSDFLQPTALSALYLNSDTTNSNYVYTILRATNYAGVTSSVQGLIGSFRPFWANPAGESSSDTYASVEVLISNYASTTNKSVKLESVNENFNSGNALAEANQYIEAANYTTSSAVTSLLITSLAGNFTQYSTASLYKTVAD